MAVTQNTIIGRTRGRIGNVVFSQWKDLNIAKQKPEAVANPRTAQQIANRLKFIALLALGKTLRPILQIGMKEYAGRLSWLNKFMSLNSGTGVLEWDGVDAWELVPENLVVSDGSLFPNPFTVSSAAGIVTIGWSTTPVSNQNGTDELFGVVICGSSTVFINGDIGRSLGTTTVDLSAEANLAPFRCALFFMRYDGLIVSSSTNVGGILVNP